MTISFERRIGKFGKLKAFDADPIWVAVIDSAVSGQSAVGANRALVRALPWSSLQQDMKLIKKVIKT